MPARQLRCYRVMKDHRSVETAEEVYIVRLLSELSSPATEEPRLGVLPSIPSFVQMDDKLARNR